MAKVRRQQNPKEFFGRYFSCYFSPYLTAVFHALGLTPNQVTASMFVAGLAGAVALCFGTPAALLAGSLCLVLVNVLDTCDGEIARLTGQSSPGGEYLDRLAHYVVEGAGFLGYAVGLAALSGRAWVVPAGAAFALLKTLEALSRDLVFAVGLDAPEERKQRKRKTSFRGGPLLAMLYPVLSPNGFFHVMPLLLLAGMALGDRSHAAVLGYAAAFAVLNAAGVLVRFWKLQRAYFP